MSTTRRSYTLHAETAASLDRISATLRGPGFELDSRGTKPSAIVSRALEAYESHLKDVLTDDGRETCDGTPVTVEIRVRFERTNLHRHSKRYYRYR